MSRGQGQRRGRENIQCTSIFGGLRHTHEENNRLYFLRSLLYFLISLRFQINVNACSQARLDGPSRHGSGVLSCKERGEI